MSERTCETCRWWAEEKERGDEPTVHQCRRYAPRPGSWQENGSTDPGWAEWPRTLPADWCGEHQPRERGDG